MKQLTIFDLVKKFQMKKRRQFSMAKVSQKQKECWAEFGHVATCGKLIRTAFSDISRYIEDQTMQTRLTRKLFNVIRADQLSPFGSRNVIHGDLRQLMGFEFNTHSVLNRVVSNWHFCETDRKNGVLAIELLPFRDQTPFIFPKNITHFRTISCAAEIDFEKQMSISDIRSSAIVTIKEGLKMNIRTEHSITPGNTHPLLVTLGIETFHRNSDASRSMDKRNCALAIIHVDLNNIINH